MRKTYRFLITLLIALFLSPLALVMSTAMTADKDLEAMEGIEASLPMGVDTIYKGAMVCFNTAGYAMPASDTAGFTLAGYALEKIANTGSAGDKSIRVRRPGLMKVVATGLVQGSVGQMMYVVDDQTVGGADQSVHKVKVGPLIVYTSATAGWVDVGGCLVVDPDPGRLEGALYQGTYEESSTQRYEIGAPRRIDERVFRYAKAGEALLAAWGAQAWNAYGSGTTRETATISVAGVSGDTTLTLAEQGTVTADMFKGGYACIYWEFRYWRIVSNTAGSGSVFTITLDHPLDEAIDAASVVSLYRNPWNDTRRLVDGSMDLWASTVGIPIKDVQSGYYYWCQTWGPCVGVGVDNIGERAAERGLYFVANGALIWQSGTPASNNQPANQYAGFLLPYTGPGPTGVDQPGALIHFMLQVAP